MTHRGLSYGSQFWQRWTTIENMSRVLWKYFVAPIYQRRQIMSRNNVTKYLFIRKLFNLAENKWKQIATYYCARLIVSKDTETRRSCIKERMLVISVQCCFSGRIDHTPEALQVDAVMSIRGNGSIGGRKTFVFFLRIS